jgi:hypothetical protein
MSRTPVTVWVPSQRVYCECLGSVPAVLYGTVVLYILCLCSMLFSYLEDQNNIIIAPTLLSLG